MWGLAQGSGKDPYQAQVDLDEPAFKCSCPSRKFPCKHGLGLLLLHASSPISADTRPAWVEEWAAKRAERVAKAEAKAAAASSETLATPADPQAQARRREKRAANVAEGLDLLDGWLRDLARQGLAAAQSWPPSAWDSCARRLIDTQAPGLARRVRQLAELAAQKGDTLAFETALSRLHLLATAARRRDSLDTGWQAEIDSLVGWSIEQEDLRMQTGATAVWFAAAQQTSEDAGINTRITHLFSPGQPPARLLEFSHGSRAIVSPIALGRAFKAELVRYPGVSPERVLLKGAPTDAERPALAFVDNCETVRAVHCAALSENPWREETAALVRLTPSRQGDTWQLQDNAGDHLPLVPGFSRAWELLACSGGRPSELCVLWDGQYLRPLSIIDGGATLPLHT